MGCILDTTLAPQDSRAAVIASLWEMVTALKDQLSAVQLELQQLQQYCLVLWQSSQAVDLSPDQPAPMSPSPLDPLPLSPSSPPSLCGAEDVLSSPLYSASSGLLGTQVSPVPTPLSPALPPSSSHPPLHPFQGDCDIPTPESSPSLAPVSGDPSASQPKASQLPITQAIASLGLVGDDLMVAVQATSKLTRPPPVLGKDGCKLARVYVQGINRMPIRDVHLYLKQLHFQVSRLMHISFLGTRTVEFLVTGDYVDGFRRRVETIGRAIQWRVLDGFDATIAADPHADAHTCHRVYAAFLRRVHRIITHAPHPAVKASYTAWLQHLCLPLPSLSP